MKYTFNYKLIDKLPSILGKLNKEVVAELGITHVTFSSWREGEMTCLSLANLCNTFRISISSFLVVGECPELTGNEFDYVYPEESWKPVVWDSAPFATLFGIGSDTGVLKTDAAQTLGFASEQIFARWAATPSAIKMKDFVNLLNTYKVDAGLFFRDKNMPVSIPSWENERWDAESAFGQRLKDYRDMEKLLADKNNEIRALRRDKERLARENLLLRAKKEDRKAVQSSTGLVAEPTVQYTNPFSERGYVFHEQLWDKLSEMFDMSRKEFCDAVGVSFRSSYNCKNLLISSVVNACNLFRISISHFFLPKNEVPVVHDSGFYVVSKRMFVPVEDCMDRMKYLFGRYSVAGFSAGDLNNHGVGYNGLNGMAKANGTGRVLTLCDICTTFNIPPYVFFNDENRRKAIYSQSINERLLLNAIEAVKEVEKLRAEKRKSKSDS